ncbi:hypothetical protein VPHD479_0188 [Vibrio phage D479]
MDNSTFLEYLKIGGDFENAVLPLLFEYFSKIDEEVAILPLANSKDNPEQGRGQVWINANGTTHAVPDFIVRCHDYLFLIDAKSKNFWFEDRFGYIDQHKVKDDYIPSLKKFKADAVLYVFGNRKTGEVYLTKTRGESLHISSMANAKNQGKFLGWDINDQIFIGKADW